ncbi:MAG: SDR family NAD(P)-dependent oxidoreductase [Gemmatimonadales bacterium]|nr:MAG: SDR family NAD(P)-dependent oxidoreductase [Gemmatimonadales bacterium]
MSKILVTGGAGFVGSHLVDSLVREGHQVTVLDVTPAEDAHHLESVRSKIHYLQGDIRSSDDVRAAFDGVPDTVYHLASVVGVQRYVSDPLAVVDVIVGGTRNVLESVTRSGSRLVVTSTSEIFGRNPEIPWAEDSDRVLGSPSVDRWSYASAKGVAEHMIFAMARRGMDASIVRFFNAYGPRQNPEFVVSQSVRQVLRGERPLIYDGGRQTRCFTFIDDIIEGTIAVGSTPEATGQAFNLGNPVETEIRQVVNRIIELADVSITPENFSTEEHFGDRYEDVSRRVPGVEKARELLGWTANTSLDDGLRATLDWAHANPWWWRGES